MCAIWLKISLISRIHMQAFDSYLMPQFFKTFFLSACLGIKYATLSNAKNLFKMLYYVSYILAF